MSLRARIVYNSNDYYFECNNESILLRHPYQRGRVGNAMVSNFIPADYLLRLVYNGIQKDDQIVPRDE